MLKRARIKVCVAVAIVMGFATSDSAYAQGSAGEAGAVLHHTPAERRELAGITLMEGVSVGTLLETEAAFGKDGGEEIGDIVLATFELDIDADLTEWARGHVLLLWEEDDTEPVDLDEATITLGDTREIPGAIVAGKMYLPFGTFNSHFVSDPLVLELGETRESAFLVRYTHATCAVQAAVFNGDMDDDEDTMDNAVVSATLMPFDGVEIGACWMSDIGESDGLQELLEERMDTVPGLAQENVPAAGAFLSLSARKLVLDAECIAATEAFGAGVLDEEALRPVAWNAELAYHSGEQWEAAIKAEGTCDLPGFPETQFGVSASMAIADSTTLAVEYLHGDYTGETADRNVATCQLALEF